MLCMYMHVAKSLMMFDQVIIYHRSGRLTVGRNASVYVCMCV